MSKEVEGMGRSRRVQAQVSARTEGARRATGVRADSAAGAGPLARGSWTPDGQVLVYHSLSVTGDMDIWSLPVSGDSVEYLATEFSEVSPRLSPNGRWLAYVSNRTGDNRVYVRAFPEGGSVFPISVGPGAEAVWSPTGRELFYRRGPEFWAVEVETETEFRAGTPRMLFEAPYANDYSGLGIPNYDVSLDGQQFLMVQSDAANEATGYAVVLNWFEELKARVPAGR